MQEKTSSSPRAAARLLPAGIADAGLASLATFGAGLSAAILFEPADLGVYGLFFAAFGLGVVLPWDLILVPAEVNAVSYPPADRMRRAPESLKMGLRMSLVGSSAMFVAAFFSRSLTDPAVIWGLVITGIVATTLSPLQDHMRRLLHIADMSWRAAATSGVQCLGVAVSLAVMLALDAPVALMPFGSLAFANAISLTAAIIMGDVTHQKPLDAPLRFWALAKEGKWLLAQALVPSVAHFAVAAIIAALAGAEALGYAEAARIVAQPVLVFATGLTAVLSPRTMRAAMDHDRAAALQVRRLYLMLVFLGGAVYLMAASTDWLFNPMGYLVPVAYVVPGLVGVTVVANLTGAAMYLDIGELLGAKMAKPMALISMVTSPILVLVAGTAAVTEAFARPLGMIARNLVEIGWYRLTIRGYYRADRPDDRDVVETG